MRDKIIEDIFITADDEMQGLLGLHKYVAAAVTVSPKNYLTAELPMGQFHMTHHWDRLYNREELVVEMEKVFEFINCRTYLITLVSTLEAAIDHFIKRLTELRIVNENTRNYKDLLNWAFSIVKETTNCPPPMLQRLPLTCGDIDNARRLRNAIIHNNGKYDNLYGVAINDGWVKVQFEADYETYKREGWSPIMIINERFDYFCRSHIEFLHILHNTIQSKFFGHHEGYHYGREKKPIEWHRILSGKKSLQM